MPTLFMNVTNLLSSSQIYRGSKYENASLFSLPLPPSLPFFFFFLPILLPSIPFSPSSFFSPPLFTTALFYCGVPSKIVFGVLGALVKRKQCSFVVGGNMHPIIFRSVLNLLN